MKYKPLCHRPSLTKGWVTVCQHFLASPLYYYKQISQPFPVCVLALSKVGSTFIIFISSCCSTLSQISNLSNLPTTQQPNFSNIIPTFPNVIQLLLSVINVGPPPVIIVNTLLNLPNLIPALHGLSLTLLLHLGTLFSSSQTSPALFFYFTLYSH